MLIALQHTKEPKATWTSKLFALAVGFRLVTKYPHGGIVENGMLRHANSKHGLHEVPFNPEGWHTFEVPDIVPGGTELFELNKGKPYDSFSLLAFLIPGRPRDSDSLYCFEWMWLRLTGMNPREKITPEMILALGYQLTLGARK